MQAAHILRLTHTSGGQLLQGGELAGEHDEAGHWLIPARVVHERLERLRRESFLEADRALLAERGRERAEELRTEPEEERDKGFWRRLFGR